MLTPEGLSENVLLQIEKLHQQKAIQIEALFSQGIDEGVFIDVKPSVLTMIASGVFAGTMMQLLENPKEDPADVIQTMETVLLNGILK